MGKDLLHGLERWCLWMADDDFDPADINRSQILRERVEACREFRANSSPKGDAFKLRNTPHLMRPNPNRPRTDYVGIPRVVSETRLYYTVDLLPAEVIAGDKVYTAEDPDGILFGLISSSMFITWQKAIGGRLESRVSFANTLTWNTFPIPPLEPSDRTRIIRAGHKVLKVRAHHPERSLADHYNPLVMDPDLLKAHDALDRVVDKAFGAPRKLSTEEQRLELLFKSYAELTNKN
jgi:hypothetical protein